jgi:hypothetical protein
LRDLEWPGNVVAANMADMPTVAHVPRPLRMLPFRGSAAVAAGLLTPAQLRGFAWRRLFPDVYLSSGVELTHRLWCEAALIYAGTQPGVAISGLSAAHLMGLDLLPSGDPPVTMTVPRTRRLGTESTEGRLVIIRTGLDQADITDDRLPSTGPLRTGFDLARLLAFPDAVVAIDAMSYRKVITIAQLRSYALGAPRLRGVANIPGVLAAAEPLAASPMETRLRLTIVAGRLPRPAAQVEIWSANGAFVGRVDLGYPAARIGIEYEGDHHRDRDTFRHDIRRYNAMREAGWTIIRVTADDLREPEGLLRQIRQALAAAGC